MESAEKQVAIYPGTFDPLTNGHVSLVRRGLAIFDQIVLAIAKDTNKVPLFNLDERVQMSKEVFSSEPRVVVEPFSGLLVNYAKQRDCNVILRGLRAVSDFEFEFQMALMNRRMHRDIHTVFMMTDYKWLYVSSTLIKETASLDGDVQGLVPEPVCKRLKKKFENESC